MTAPGPFDDQAVALLRALSGPHGIHASLDPTATPNYRAVFTRDAVMAGVAGLLIGDATITASFVRTLEHLRDLQGPEGQIPSNYAIGGGAQPQVSFGTLAPRLDAATWYLVGIGLAAHTKVVDPELFRDSATRAVRLLNAIEYNGRHLLYVPPGGNWADEYIYDGYILYDQVIRAWGLRLLGSALKEPSWTLKAEHISQTIAERYWPAEPADRRHPLASFSPLGVRDIFDLAAVALLGVSGVAPDLVTRTLPWISERFLAHQALPPVFHPVIDEGHSDWPALRRYHLHAFRNLPHEYHNGGVWPIWLGWFALALAATEHLTDLARLRALVSGHLAAHPAYAFEEYFHGFTGDPRGTRAMAYSATGVTFLRHAGSSAQRRLFGQ